MVQRFKDVWNHLFKEGVCEEGILAIRTPLVSFPRDLGLGWFLPVIACNDSFSQLYLFIFRTFKYKTQANVYLLNWGT